MLLSAFHQRFFIITFFYNCTLTPIEETSGFGFTVILKPIGLYKTLTTDVSLIKMLCLAAGKTLLKVGRKI
jgi:hypothetical protein